MRTIVALILFFFGTAGIAPAALAQKPATFFYWPPAGAIVLRVEVLSVEYTDWSPGCDDNEETCIPVTFWYRYRARVKEVIAGSWSDSQVEFTHLQHAGYIPEVTNDCYVVLLPAEPDLSYKIGVPFVADRILSRFWKRDRAVIKALRDGT